MRTIILATAILSALGCARIGDPPAGGAVIRYDLIGDSTAWIGVVDGTVVEMVRNGMSWNVNGIDFEVRGDTAWCDDPRAEWDRIIFVKSENNY